MPGEGREGDNSWFCVLSWKRSLRGILRRLCCPGAPGTSWHLDGGCERKLAAELSWAASLWAPVGVTPGRGYCWGNGFILPQNLSGCAGQRPLCGRLEPTHRRRRVAAPVIGGHQGSQCSLSHTLDHLSSSGIGERNNLKGMLISAK